MKNLFICLMIVLGVASNADPAGSSAIQWLGYCSQEVNRDQARIFRPGNVTSEQQGNYCVSLEEQSFQPAFHLPGDHFDEPEDRPLPENPATMLLVSVDLEKLKIAGARLVVSVEQKMPVCQECEGGCWKLEKLETVSKSFPLTGNAKRYIIDVWKIIPSWNLMGIKVKATVLDGGKVIDESDLEKEGWAWCA